MKVTIENKKGLSKDIKVIIDKKTMDSYLENKYEEIKKNYTLKGFRPGKAPREVLKRQFGEAIMGEVLDKVLKDTSAKALEENKIRPATQPKIDLKKYGEGKDLEYVMSVTELPQVDTKQLQNIKFDEYKVKIDKKHTDERINQIAKSQNNFKDAGENYKAAKGNLVIFDYKATSEGKDFKGNEGKNTQLILGKDLFIKGFDEQLIGVKKNDSKKVEVKLPENFPEKDLVNKKAIFVCNITNVKINHEVKVDDEFAKSLGAKDLNGLKELISKQINDEYKNSLDMLSKNEILNQLDKIKIEEVPQELVDQEIHVLSHGMKDDEIKNNKKDLESQAKKRIKTGLILNEFGQKNKINVTEQELNMEIQKQFQMMPGQEKMVKDYYEKNPSAIASLRGSIYEEKIITEIKKQAKANVESEILMMSDVDCRLAEGVLLMIASRFRDDSIGAVTGRQILLNLGQNRKSAEEGSYRDFFSRMRIAESRFYSTPIFHGECAAYRRKAILGHKLVENSNADDSQMAVSVIRSGFRAIYDSEIIFYEVAPPDGQASKIQKVRRAQGLVRHFWRNRDMIFDRSFGNFRKVMALEFILHIVLPIAMVIGFIAGFSHIGLLINEFGIQFNSVNSLPSVDKLMLISDVLVMLLLSAGIMGIPLPGSRLSATFFNFMITLFKAQILILSGRSLHQWQQVSAVRDILAEFDRNS